MRDANRDIPAKKGRQRGKTRVLTSSPERTAVFIQELKKKQHEDDPVAELLASRVSRGTVAGSSGAGLQHHLADMIKEREEEQLTRAAVDNFVVCLVKYASAGTKKFVSKLLTTINGVFEVEFLQQHSRQPNQFYLSEERAHILEGDVTKVLPRQTPLGLTARTSNILVFSCDPLV